MAPSLEDAAEKISGCYQGEGKGSKGEDQIPAHADFAAAGAASERLWPVLAPSDAHHGPCEPLQYSETCKR